MSSEFTSEVQSQPRLNLKEECSVFPYNYMEDSLENSFYSQFPIVNQMSPLQDMFMYLQKPFWILMWSDDPIRFWKSDWIVRWLETVVDDCAVRGSRRRPPPPRDEICNRDDVILGGGTVVAVIGTEFCFVAMSDGSTCISDVYCWLRTCQWTEKNVFSIVVNVEFRFVFFVFRFLIQRVCRFMTLKLSIVFL